MPVESLTVRAVICDTCSNEIVVNSGMAASIRIRLLLKNQIYRNVIPQTAVNAGSTVARLHVNEVRSRVGVGVMNKTPHFD
jgi:hypothetical protein